MPVVATLIDDPAGLEPHRPAWDRLAETSARPFCASAWMLAWLRHVPGPAARLRAVLVTDDDVLVGVAPFVLLRRRGLLRLALLGAGTSAGVDVLAAPGREADVARAVRDALGTARPRAAAISFDGVPGSSPFPSLLAGAPGAVRGDVEVPAPYVDLRARDAEQWLASRSKNFRSRMRQAWRRMTEQGAAARLTTGAGELERDLAAFHRLHGARWDFRGGSGVVDGGVREMVEAAAGELLAQGRLRLWSLEAGGEIFGSHLCLTAGGVTSWWLGGFDEAWKAHSPAVALLQRIVEDGFARGERRLDLGAGGQPFKYRLSDGEEVVSWSVLPLPGPGRPLVLGELLAKRTRRALRERRASPA